MAIDPRFYFGTIEAGTRLGLQTADIWSMIRDQAENAGLASPGVTAQDVSRMRGQASSIRRSDAALNSAAGNLGLDAAMIAVAPWARDLNRRNAVAMHQVRFLHTTMKDGVQSSDWRNVMLTGPLPATVDDLRARVENAGQQMARDYGAGHVAVEALSLLAV